MKYLMASLGAALMVCTAAPAIAQTGGLASSSKLEADPGESDSWTYRHPTVAIGTYKRFLIMPTIVNTDPTANWGKTTPEQRQKFAAYMTEALTREVGKGYQVVQKPGPGTAKMQLTLLGVQTTTTLVATASRLSPMGLALNSMKSLTGRQGSFTGSAQAAFELTDSRTGELLFAAVRRRSPNALDIKATLSTESTVKAVADEVASSIRRGLDQANGR